MDGACERVCGYVQCALIAVVLIALSPLLLVEILLLLLCNIRCLPPLSCMLNTSPLTGIFDSGAVPAHTWPLSPDLERKKESVDVRGMTNWWKPTGSVPEAVRTACESMLAYNTVSTTHKCPPDLQGVFWMDGNKIPEELACLSYAAFDDKATMNGNAQAPILNKVNGVLSWTYLDSSVGKFIAWFQEKDEATGMQVFQFQGADCRDGRIWSYTSFDYQNLNWLTSIGKFSMERLPGPGVNFKRGCYWFDKVFGDRLEFGSYTLRKIMHTDLTPVQPAYDDFVRYMATKNAGVSQIMEAPVGAADAERTPLRP